MTSEPNIPEDPMRGSSELGRETETIVPPDPAVVGATSPSPHVAVVRGETLSHTPELKPGETISLVSGDTPSQRTARKVTVPGYEILSQLGRGGMVETMERCR